MKNFEYTLSIIYFAKSSDKPHGYSLFAANEAYQGNFDNKVANRIIDSLGLIIKNQEDKNNSPVREPRVDVDNDVIFIPSKAYFPNELSYYHLLLHETAHYLAFLAKQDKPMQDTYLAHAIECVSNNKPFPNLNDLVDTVRTEEAFKNASPAAQNRVLAYLREEVKAETVAMHSMYALGYDLSKEDKQSFCDSINQSNKIAKFAGIDLKQEITDKHSAYSKEAKVLSNAIEIKLKEASKELGLEPSNSKSKIHNKDKDL